MVARNDIALDVAHAIVIPKDLEIAKDETVNNNNNTPYVSKCRKCQKPIRGGDLAVVAPRFALRDFWHPGCFSCATCDELLVDLAYCVFDESILCERHYAENLKPRCAACDELIFAGQYTKVRLSRNLQTCQLNSSTFQFSGTGQRFSCRAFRLRFL